MEIIIKKVFRHPMINGGKTKITKIIIEGTTFDECFRKKYELDRGDRYNNYQYHEFEDDELKTKYMEWKEKNETIELYYGGGVVD